MPGIYKIGFTRGHPRVRMAQLSSTTACPTPFEMLAMFDHSDAEYAEKCIHKALDRYRVNSAREFFQVPLRELQDQARQWCDPYEGLVCLDCLDMLCDQEDFNITQEGDSHG